MPLFPPLHKYKEHDDPQHHQDAQTGHEQSEGKVHDNGIDGPGCLKTQGKEPASLQRLVSPYPGLPQQGLAQQDDQGVQRYTEGPADGGQQQEDDLGIGDQDPVLAGDGRKVPENERKYLQQQGPVYGILQIKMPEPSVDIMSSADQDFPDKEQLDTGADQQ